MKKLEIAIVKEKIRLIRERIEECEVIDGKGMTKVVREFNTNYLFVIKYAGDLIEEQKRKKTKKIIEEYKKISMNLSKTREAMDKSLEIVKNLASKNGVSQLFAFRALGALFPYYSTNGCFEIGDEIFCHPKVLAKEFGDKKIKTVRDVMMQLNIPFVKILTLENGDRFVKFYSLSEALKRCFSYARNYRINQCFQDKNFLKKLREEKPPNMKDEELLAIAILVVHYDLYGIWLQYKELAGLLAGKGIKNGHGIIKNLIDKGFVRHKKETSKQVFEISIICPPLLVFQYVKCLSSDCFYCRDGKKHKIRKSYVFDPKEELKERWAAFADIS